MSARRTRRMTAEARVARVAYLLSGSVRSAAEVIDRVQRAQPRLENVTPEHLDRLVVVHAREWAAAARKRKPRRAKVSPADGTSGVDAAPVVAPNLSYMCHDAALGMDRQHAEAWLFRHIDEMDDAQISRAMDSSRTAAHRHLEAAEVTMHARLGDQLLPATAALREHVQGMGAEAFVSEQREIRRARLKRRGIMLAIGCTAVVVLAIVAWAVVF